MTWSEVAILVGMGASVLPVIAGYLRHRSSLVWLATLAGSVCLISFFAVLRGVARVEPGGDIAPWLFALTAFGVPLILAVYLLSGSLGREEPVRALRSRRGTFFVLALGGVAFLLLLRSPAFIAGYSWVEGGRIVLGPLGKAYLSYLLVGVVFTGYNLETTYRMAGGGVRDRLRPALLGMFGVLGYVTFVLTTGLLYGGLGLPSLVAFSVPVFLGSMLVAYGYLRGALTDAAVPVSRNVVYTSFTAFVAAVYVLAVGLIAQFATLLHWSPGQAVSLSIGFVLVISALALILSHRLQRTLRRFIDRNFYVNRYDYRTQWFRVTRSLDAAGGPEGMVGDASQLIQEVLRAERITVALFDRATDSFRPVVGDGVDSDVSLPAQGSPLVTKLNHERRSLLLDRHPEDFEYIPIYVEDRDWLETTASRVVAPLLAGPHLLGMIGLERVHPEDRFTFEDLDLLDSLSAHVAASLRAAQLSRDLDDAREMELLSQWSGMLLHDLKNQLSPLRLLVHNLRTSGDDPEFRKVALEDLTRVAGELEGLVQRLSELRTAEKPEEETVSLARVVHRTVARLQLERNADLDLVLDLPVEGAVLGDEALLRRVVENLVVNAVEAMDGAGRLKISLVVREKNEAGNLELQVTDTGVGMDPGFVRDQLFRPFATTKRKGLGLGLYQCRSIVQAHGGELTVQSEPGKGSTFRVVLSGHREVPRALSAGARTHQ